MKTDFPKITILGGGLLGGSLALALAKLDNAPVVHLWARKPATVEAAKNLGIANVTVDLAAAVKDSALVILAVPVGSMESLVIASLKAGLPDGCLITDVGSVKRVPHRKLYPLLKDLKTTFIGSHPMAGSERNGLAAVSDALFQNAACIMTNDAEAPPELTTALENFWKAIGCRTSWMSAAIHDELVARISHLPHLVAASATRVCLKDPSEGKFGGGGLRDTTRVAAGNPTMWAEIVIENRSALIELLEETVADLGEMLDCLRDADQGKARQWLVTAKERRDPLNKIC